MKRMTDPLLKDMLRDDTSPEFHAALMRKTLRCARRRKYTRRAGVTLGVLALVAAVFMTLPEKREPDVSLRSIRPQPLAAAPAPSARPVQIISTTPDSSLTVVRTSESDKPAEINDRQLFALLGGRPVALIHPEPGQSELIVFAGNGPK